MHADVCDAAMHVYGIKTCIMYICMLCYSIALNGMSTSYTLFRLRLVWFGLDISCSFFFCVCLCVLLHHLHHQNCIGPTCAHTQHTVAFVFQRFGHGATRAREREGA